MATTAKTAAKKTAPKASAPKANKSKKTETPITPEFNMNNVEEFWANGTEKAQEQIAKAQASVEEIASFGKDSVEVMVETASLAQKGFEAIAAETATYTQKSYEDGVAAAKETFAATNVQEAIEMQTKFAKTATEAYFGHLKTVGEMFQASANEVAAPWNARMTSIFENVYKA